MLGSGCRVQVLGCRVQGVGFRFQVVGFRVQSVGFRIQFKNNRLYRNAQRFRGGLVFKARRLINHSTLGLRVITKRESRLQGLRFFSRLWFRGKGLGCRVI